jgi:hypothetical protein
VNKENWIDYKSFKKIGSGNQFWTRINQEVIPKVLGLIYFVKPYKKGKRKKKHFPPPYYKYKAFTK